MSDDEDLMAAHTRALLLAATTAAVVGSTRVGLLEAILAKPRSREELASELGLHEDATRRVVDLLATIGVTARDEAGRVVPGALLDADARGPAGGPARSLQIWSGIEEYLRTGRTFLETLPGKQPRGPAYSTAVVGLGRIFRPLSEELASTLGEASGAGRILDLGAGSGQWSLAMLARDPRASVTALDLEPVLPRFLEHAQASGLEDRVDTIAADYHHAALVPATYDRIVAANVLHLESEEDAAALIGRLAPALAERGQLVVVDALPGPGFEGDPSFAAYALSLGLRTGGGRPHAEADLRGWMQAAGLDSVARVEIGAPGSMVAALVGSRSV